MTQTSTDFPFVLLAQNEAPMGGDQPTSTGDDGAAQGEGDGAGTLQDGSQQNLPNGGGQQAPGLFDGPMIFIILAVFLVMWIFLLGGNRKEKKRKAEMLASLGKGDKIQTIGGILGTIVELRDDEVVVKIDENTNARMRFARSAIQGKLEERHPSDDSKS